MSGTTFAELRAKHADEITLEPLYCVVQRGNGQWDAGAKILDAFATEADAEIAALRMKIQNQQATFGVFALRSEARQSKTPFVLVKVGE